MKETLEEASKNRGLRWHKEGTIGFMHSKGDFIAGAKWQAERMYSEEDILEVLNKYNLASYFPLESNEIKEWFNQFKK